MRSFESLSEQEVLALAIALEEEDERVYSDFAENFRKDFPATGSMFEEMRDEESTHRRRLIDLYRTKFGEHIPLIRRGDVKGLVTRRAIWLTQPLRPEAARRQASTLEVETRMFYEKAASRTQDASIRQLLNDLAQEEREHELRAEELGRERLDAGTRGEEDEASRRLFVLQIVQPGLAGLMDGSVSTLAPVFAAAFARHESHFAFLVGLAASLGAGISMGFAEALSDDGSLTGRGHPWVRGFVCGLMTTLGGIGHTLPFLIPSFRIATIVAVFVVIAELGAASLHGNALGFRDATSGAGRDTGFCGRRADREFVGNRDDCVESKTQGPSGLLPPKRARSARLGPGTRALMTTRARSRPSG
jgi:rubrerythrin